MSSSYKSKFGKTFFSESVTIADGKALNISDNAISGAEKITGLREELDSFQSMEGTVKSFVISTSAMNNDKEFHDETMTNLSLSNKSHLTGMNFSGSTMSNSNFSNSNVSSCNFDGCNLTECNFTNTDVTDATFSGAVLTGIIGKDIVETGGIYYEEVEEIDPVYNKGMIRISGDSTTMLLINGDKFSVVRYNSGTNKWEPLGNSNVNISFTNSTFDSMKINYDGTKVFFGSPVAKMAKAFQYNNVDNTWEAYGQEITSIELRSIGINNEGTRMVVSNYTNAGQLIVYEINEANTNWDEIGNITETGTQTFGFSVCMSSDGNTIVGLSQGNNTVYVYRFVDENTGWIQSGSFISTNNADLVTLSRDGTFLAISSVRHQSLYLYTTVLHFDGATWSKIGDTLIHGDGTNSSSGSASFENADVNFSKSNKTLYYSNGLGYLFIYAYDETSFQLKQTIVNSLEIFNPANALRTCTINQLETEELKLYIENSGNLVVYSADLTLIDPVV